MERIACLLVPDFPLAACLRAEPEARGTAIAVCESHEPGALLLAVSPEAHAMGLEPGMSVARAQALGFPLGNSVNEAASHPDRSPGATRSRRPDPDADQQSERPRTPAHGVSLRVVPPKLRRSAHDALLDVAASFSPRIESGEEGVVWLDTDGLTILFGSEEHLVRILAGRSRRVGLEAAVGIGRSKMASLLAARSGLGVLSREREAADLAPLPVFLLGTTSDLALTLAHWGIRTFGDLTRLPRESVGSRLGAAGLALWRTARGEERRPLCPRLEPLVFEEMLDCEYGIDSFEPFSFLLRGALERLLGRLDLHGLRAGDLTLVLCHEDGGREERTILVATPTGEAQTLLALARLDFERRPPRAPIESFRLRAVAERLRPVSLDLFAPSGPLPDELDVAVARLASITGRDHVGTPRGVDTHRPESYALDSPSLPPALSSPVICARLLALRAFRPPVALKVVCDRGRPDYVTSAFSGNGESAPLHGRIVHYGGPMRLSGEWWRDDERLGRDYYDLEISSGSIVRAYRDHVSDRWYAAGIYD